MRDVLKCTQKGHFSKKLGVAQKGKAMIPVLFQIGKFDMESTYALLQGKNQSVCFAYRKQDDYRQTGRIMEKA